MKQFNGNSRYIAGGELARAVNVAIALEKPLLIKGEPGTGKTKLAEAVAESLDCPLVIWNIKSTTKAQDGLYVYDVVQRLYDSQFGQDGVDNIAQYIRLGKLGDAFVSERQAVLLIDEIDKADLEFPNDLLWELDRMEFYIPETGTVIRARRRPIVIITSNAEKELPDAFLRRCLFYYIPFPPREEMISILRLHVTRLDETLLEQGLDTFYWLRSLTTLKKRPGTSELIDWFRALEVSGAGASGLRQNLPCLGVLLKKDEDMETARRYLPRHGA